MTASAVPVPEGVGRLPAAPMKNPVFVHHNLKNIHK
jgi:hypothetical protein